MSFRHTLSIAVLAAASMTSIQAGLVTSSAGFTSPQVVDFNQFGYYLFSAGPTAVSNPPGMPVDFSATTGSAVVGSGGYGLGNNGNWGLTHTGLNSDSGYMQFAFLAGPVQAVGGFINYAPSSTAMPSSKRSARAAWCLSPTVLLTWPPSAHPTPLTAASSAASSATRSTLKRSA